MYHPDRNGRSVLTVQEKEGSADISREAPGTTDQSKRNVATRSGKRKLTPALVWLQAVRDDPRVSRAEWGLAAALYSHMDANGGNCRPSNATLLREMRYSSGGTLRNVRSELAKHRYLDVGHWRKSSRYVPLIAGVSLTGDSQCHSPVTPTVIPRSAEGVSEGVTEGVNKETTTNTNKEPREELTQTDVDFSETSETSETTSETPNPSSKPDLEALSTSGRQVPVSSHNDTTAIIQPVLSLDTGATKDDGNWFLELSQRSQEEVRKLNKRDALDTMKVLASLPGTEARNDWLTKQRQSQVFAYAVGEDEEDDEVYKGGEGL